MSQRSTIVASGIGFFFGCRVILLTVAVRLFGWEPRNAAAAVLMVNYACVLIALAQPGTTRDIFARLWHPPARWALVYVLLSGTSLLWTAADSVVSACAFWVAMSSDLLCVLVLVQKGPAEVQASALMRGFVYGACVLCVVAWLLPAQSDLRLGDEELLGPNQIGFQCAMGLFFAQFQIKRGNTSLRLPFFFLAVTLLRSLSKTTIVAFFMAEAVLLLRDRGSSRRARFTLFVGSVLLLVIFTPLFFEYTDVYRNLGNQSLTLSGRISIWAYILDEALQSPWIGHGFHSVWKVIPPMNGDFEPRHAHNELLQQFYAYGAIGIALMATYYVSFLRAVRRFGEPEQRVFLIGVLVFCVVRGLTDTEVFDLSLPCWAVVLWSAFLRQPEEAAARPSVHGEAAIAANPGMSLDCHL